MEYVGLNQAYDYLMNHDLVAIPTETVYGLVGLATDQIAIDKIFTYKQRPADNPLICHFASIQQIRQYVTSIPKPIELLLENFSPGPLTVLLDLKDQRLSPATRGQACLACRIPANSLTLQLLEKIRIPLAAPSANPSGLPSATTAEMVFEYFQDYPGGILEFDQSEIGLESTILQYREGMIHILRRGAIGENEIKNVLPNVEVVSNQSHTQTIPGAKYRHYSPQTIVYQCHNLSQVKANSVLITTKNTSIVDLVPNVPVIYVAKTNNPEEIARNLYQSLIQVDSLPVEQAYWYVPELDYTSSLGQALANRLSKILIV